MKDLMENWNKFLEEDKLGSEVSNAAQATLDKATKLQKISNEQIEEMVRQELEEKCWPGYQRVPGTEKGAPGSCEKKNEEKQIEEGEICDAGISYVLRTDPGGKDIHRGNEDTDGDGEKEIKNWSARAAQIASKYCKDPDYGKGRGKDAKDEQLTNEGDLAAWGNKEKDGGEEWVHSDGTPCGGGDKDGSQSRCKPKAKWKTMTKGEKAADNAKKKAGTKAGKQYVPATKKGKVTKSYTKRDESISLTEDQIERIVEDIFVAVSLPAMSEGLKYHIENKIPLSDSIYRLGSEQYFNLYNEARKLASEGKYQFNEEDSAFLQESDIGEFAMLEGEMVPLDFPMYIMTEEEYEIAEKKKKEKGPIGKPMKNSGSGKKYKVYVRDKKTGNVKTLTYGDSKGGLKGNWNDPEARASFAARHDCENKTDRTKAGYWACRAHKHFGTNVPGRFW